MASIEPRKTGLTATVRPMETGHWRWLVHQDGDRYGTVTTHLVAHGMKRTRGGAVRKANAEARAIYGRRKAQDLQKGAETWEVSV